MGKIKNAIIRALGGVPSVGYTRRELKGLVLDRAWGETYVCKEPAYHPSNVLCPSNAPDEDTVRELIAKVFRESTKCKPYLKVVSCELWSHSGTLVSVIVPILRKE